MPNRYQYIPVILMILFTIIITFSVCKVRGHYCDTRECPGFSLIRAVQIGRVSAESIEVTWSPKENYKIEKYEVQWYSTYKCDKCNGNFYLFNTTSLLLKVEACKTYFFEVYAIETNSTRTAPGLISQLTVADPLHNGTALLISCKWAILRWVQMTDCPVSVFVAVCYGPNSVTQTKPYLADRVVIFNVSILQENSSYMCVSYTVNAAGSSLPSSPIFFTTAEDSFKKYAENGALIGCTVPIIVAVFASLTIILFYATKKETLKLPWRRSYDVAQTV